MKLSIVIPAYNEEESIVETIDQIEEAFAKVNIDHEIFIVNDNSKDGTLACLNNWLRNIRRSNMKPTMARTVLATPYVTALNGFRVIAWP